MAAEKIRGIPVWQLDGVTDENLAAVKETDIWVHYKKRKFDGWCICAPEKIYQLVLADLAKRGITDGGELVITSNWTRVWIKWFVFSVPIIGIPYFLGNEALTGLAGIFCFLFLPFILSQTIKYGDAIKPLLNAREDFTPEWRSSINDTAYGSMPGNIYYVDRNR